MCVGRKVEHLLSHSSHTLSLLPARYEERKQKANKNQKSSAKIICDLIGRTANYQSVNEEIQNDRFRCE